MCIIYTYSKYPYIYLDDTCRYFPYVYIYYVHVTCTYYMYIYIYMCVYMFTSFLTEQDHQGSSEKLHCLSLLRSEMSVPSGRMAQAGKTLEELG